MGLRIPIRLSSGLDDGTDYVSETSARLALITYSDRICPGRHLADASLLIMCASILHVFKISPPLDEDGRPKPLRAEFTDDMITS